MTRFSENRNPDSHNRVPTRQALAYLWGNPGIRAAVLVLVTLAAYFPALHAGYIWDDDVTLTNNPAIKAANGLAEIWSPGKGIDFIPLTLTAFWLEWRLWGDDPTGYHLTNILLHALNAVLVWRCLLRLKVPGPWRIALLFAVHPVGVASVAWISERKNTLSTVFFLLSALFYFRMSSLDPSKSQGSEISHNSSRAVDMRFYWLALGCFLAALLAKTAVVVLPCVLLVCCLWMHGRITREDLMRTGPFFAMAFVLGLVTIWYQFRGWSPGAFSGKSFPLLDRLLGGGWAVWFYLAKALVPANLSMIYPRWEIDVKSAVAYLPGLIWAAGLGLCGLCKFRLCRGCLFGLACFTMMLSPVLGVFQMSFHQHSRVADHFQYLGLIPVMALVIAAIDRFSAIRLRSFVVFAAFVCFSLMTWRQASVYRTPITLWSDTIAKNPSAWMAYNNLGLALFQEGKRARAVEMYGKALQLKPDYAAGECNLADALAALGRAPDALTHYNKALQQAPNYSRALNNRGILLLQMGNAAAAIADFSAALHVNPKDAEAQNNMGIAWLQSGQGQQAKEAFSAAIRIRPSFAAAYRNLGRALLDCGSQAQGMDALQHAVRLNPALAEAWHDLAELFDKQNQPARASECFSKAVGLWPKNAEIQYRFGLFLSKRGQTLDAVTHLREAVELRPNWTEALNNLAWMLASDPDPNVRNGAEAVHAAEAACRLAEPAPWQLLDTLAAAYAEVGQFEKATTVMGRAIEMLGANSEKSARLKQRLACYESRQPWRESRQPAVDPE